MATEARRAPVWRGCQNPGGPGRHGNGCWCLPPGPLAEDRERWARFGAEIDARIGLVRIDAARAERARRRSA